MAPTDPTGAELTARKRERNEAHFFFVSFSPARIKWMHDKPSPENLVSLLETQLPRSPECPGGCQQVECGICYGQCLPIDDEHATKSGSDTEYTCENTNCSRVLHSMCLVGWLHSITITTQSFNFPFGNRPCV